MDHAKSFDVLTSLPVRHAILPRAMCLATSRPANHAICSFIDSSGYASGPIRRCLLIDYIINSIVLHYLVTYIITPIKSPCISCSEHKNRSYKSLMLWKNSKALSRLCKWSHFKMTGRSCTDTIQEKAHHFKKSHFLVWYKILLIYILISLKLSITAVL